MKYPIIKKLAEDIINEKAFLRKETNKYSHYYNQYLYIYRNQDYSTRLYLTQQERDSVVKQVKKMNMRGELDKKQNLAQDYVNKKVMIARQGDFYYYFYPKERKFNRTYITRQERDEVFKQIKYIQEAEKS